MTRWRAAVDIHHVLPQHHALLTQLFSQIDAAGGLSSEEPQRVLYVWARPGDARELFPSGNWVGLIPARTMIEVPTADWLTVIGHTGCVVVGQHASEMALYLSLIEMVPRRREDPSSSWPSVG